MSVCTATLPGSFVRYERPVRLRRAPERQAVPVRAVHTPPRTPARAGSAAGPVHLTRRGRAALLLAAVSAVLAAFGMGRAASGDQQPVSRPAPMLQATVAPGESLWSVAQHIAPGRDPRDVVAQLQRINHLRGGDLRAGQQLLLPAAAGR